MFNSAFFILNSEFLIVRCRRQDLNLHILRYQILSLARLPISPLRPYILDSAIKRCPFPVRCRMPMSILIHVSTIIADSERRILFVREAKAVHRGLWNFPGGHVEMGEHPVQAAIREVMEETSLDVSIARVIGIYSGISPNIQTIRFVFEAASYNGVATPGDEILEVRWMSSEEILQKEDRELVGARFLRAIVQDWQAGRSYPLEVITNM